MSKSDIYRKLKDLGTDEEKFRYLKRIYQKVGILKPETQKSFYEVLGDYALKTLNLGHAYVGYKNAGSKKGLIKVGDELLRIGAIDDAENLVYDKLGKKLPRNKLIKIGRTLIKERKQILEDIDYLRELRRERIQDSGIAFDHDVGYFLPGTEHVARDVSDIDKMIEIEKGYARDTRSLDTAYKLLAKAETMPARGGILSRIAGMYEKIGRKIKVTPLRKTS